MDFEIDEELKMIQSLVKDFVNDQLKPLERDILGRAADLSDSRTYLPPETEEGLVKMTKDMGLWGVGIPEELAGVGLSTLGNCLVEEELAQTIIPFNFGDVTPILFDCNDTQMESYFLPALNRQKQPYLALMEAGNEKDALTIRTKAKTANSHYVINGQKMSLSRVGKDYFAIVFAATSDSGVRDGITCFLVDKDTPGFEVVGGEEMTGWQSQMRLPTLLNFEQCHVPRENILGEEGKAFSLGKKWLPSRRIVRSARSIGVAQRLLEEATIRVQSWQSFGQFVSERPSIQAALTDIAVAIHTCRLIVYEAAWKADKGESVRREAAMVKLFATQTLNNVADNMAHIYGGPPYVAGLPMERLCRHALATSSTELSMELQRSIISTDILKGLKV
ncbi:acyl-CoA dehydrogenase family protein [Chloroflexota bacterium]